jgi:small subunit ribosomal protein S21
LAIKALAIKPACELFLGELFSCKRILVHLQAKIKTKKTSAQMIRVTVKENESIDKALKRFKKKLEKTGTLKEYRTRQYFVKDSVIRRNLVGKAVYKQHFIENQE